MITISRDFGIDYGHRLVNHESKCRHVHGHRGLVRVELIAPNLDHIGRVLDFGEIKTRLGNWLDENFDHAFIAEEGDPIIPWLAAHEMRTHVMDAPPTAEHLARYVGFTVFPKLLQETPCKVVRVIWWETPNCSATWVL